MHKNETTLLQIWQQYVGFINTPDLLLNQILVPYPNFELTPRAIKPDDLSEAFLNDLQKQAYLGKRAEIFLKHFLQIDEKADLLSFSLQVIKNKQTLGEFDFLWKYENQYLHTELVYKQYIFIKGLGKDELSSWVGPNKKDFLHLKLKKLNHKQFPLLFNDTTEKLLEEKFGLKATDFQQKLCFKAQLYVHFKEEQIEFTGVNSSAIVGKWYYFEEFKKQNFDAFQFALIPKQDWPILTEDAKWLSWFSFPEISSRISMSIQEKRSVKLWMKTSEELLQLFVVFS